MISEFQDSRSDREVLTSCYYDCGGRCLLNVRIKDGKITHIGTDMRPMPSLKACSRGLAQREVVYAPDRLTKPLKRVGKRGEGRYEPISWEEALEKVSSELLKVKNDFGNSAIFLMDYTGSLSPLQGMGKAAKRFFSHSYGCTWPPIK
jgi:Tat-targeted selenate reductase subunit YnfE/Tat-targeted selenate reductase subunit YnfF